MEPPEKKVQELPDDIWNQILLRLPAESVIGLKSVCKSWSELINSKNFQISHFDHWRIRVYAETKSQLVTLWPTPPALLSFEPVSNDDIDIPKLHSHPLTFDLPLRRSQRRLSGPPESKTTVLHSDDGLLLLRMNNQLFLCNPLTKSYLFLPFPENSTDQEIHDWTWTFVHDPSSRGYVIFYVDDFSYQKPATVYSLRIELNDSGSGRKIRAWQQVRLPVVPETLSFCFRASISINGNAHFLIDFGDTGILTIDSATEESTVTMCSGAKPKMVSVFFKSGRELYGLNKSSSGKAFELWVIDDVDNPTWSKRHVIAKPTFYDRIRIPYIGILKQGDRLIIHFRFSRCALKSVFIYDTSLEKWQQADIVGNNIRQNIRHKLMPVPIHYSLLSLN